MSATVTPSRTGRRPFGCAPRRRATLAVRRHEIDTYGDADPAEVADRLRYAWSA